MSVADLTLIQNIYTFIQGTMLIQCYKVSEFILYIKKKKKNSDTLVKEFLEFLKTLCSSLKQHGLKCYLTEKQALFTNLKVSPTNNKKFCHQLI